MRVNDTIRLLACVLTSFALTAVLEPVVIVAMRKLKARQTILHYVDKHEGKSGTPTMGGIGFLIAIAVTTAIYYPSWRSGGMVAALFMLAYAVVGFLDDFLKIWHKENLGLKAYQKVIGQLGVAIFVTLYCYRNPQIGTTIRIPFFDVQADLGWWYVPLCLIATIAMSNAVNLTDGLDGLVATTGAVYFACFAGIAFAAFAAAQRAGDVLQSGHLLSVACFCAAVVGGVGAFGWFNFNPAKIFMGDTGALALGGAAACVALFVKNPLLMLLPGIMYLVSCISVIVQVIWFKATGKRVFLMAPFHHHLEYKGVKEWKIVYWYAAVTAIGTVLAWMSLAE